MAAMAAMVMLLTASCENFEIPGTRWAGMSAGQVEVAGFTLNFGINDTLTFTSENAGRLVQQAWSYGVEYVEGDRTTIEFTYKFDGTNGTLTYNRKAHPFKYNKKTGELTLQYILPDEPGYDEYVEQFYHNEVYFKMY